MNKPTKIYFLGVLLSLLSFTFTGCMTDSANTGDNTDSTATKDSSDTAANNSKELNVYSHRHYDTDKALFKKFTEQTGIKVNVVKASADELINKLETEGKNSPADVLITVDAGRLYRAKEKGLFQVVNSEKIAQDIPAKFRDKDNHWFGLTYRARIVVYNKDKIKPEQLSTYEDLADPKWKGKVLIRSSNNIYNQSLMAAIIGAVGEEKAKAWAKGMVSNFARAPKGNDRDQVKAIKAGIGDLAVVNTYYIGKLLNSKKEEEVAAGKAVGIFFPNQKDRGAHVNISGIGVTKYAPNKANAIKFIEFLASQEAQEAFAKGNYEYPVKEGVAWADLLKSWGEFKTDEIDLSLLGKNNKKAVMTFDEVGWK
jgi:iron(III) transport system substrate-binding protein